MRGLTQEQTTKLKSYQSNKEILKLAKERGAELTDGQLKAVNGGNYISNPTYPNFHQKVSYESWRSDCWYDYLIADIISMIIPWDIIVNNKKGEH